MEIIKLQKNDIKNALNLVWTVFQEFEAPDYSKQGIEEFRKFVSYNYNIEKFDKGELYFWGCVDNDDLVGVLSTRGINHICMLFVNKEYHRRGIARSLFQIVEEKCKSQNNISKITLNSSPYAISIYHHLGFFDTDKELTMNGIRYTPMSYLLK
ncbi:GNAT family N-acetyltransferase [Clostridium estertheticum]|uniref:GNAT family N-acetyltransferase n=1 Tax=Clostridium estertheticum TaxID=238834 RepID=UPI001C0B131F|nr:GNAT family N-acetyltransferase [Clostridium estertheticum]MBU3171785.1 GNAT family N-acetyltransferase [Clostridium estertheticum]